MKEKKGIIVSSIIGFIIGGLFFMFVKWSIDIPNWTDLERTLLIIFSFTGSGVAMCFLCLFDDEDIFK